MKVTVIHRPSGEKDEVEIPDRGTVLTALRAAKIPPDVTICMMNGKPVPVDRTLADGESFEAITVVSGG